MYKTSRSRSIINGAGRPPVVEVPVGREGDGGAGGGPLAESTHQAGHGGAVAVQPHAGVDGLQLKQSRCLTVLHDRGVLASLTVNVKK